MVLALCERLAGGNQGDERKRVTEMPATATTATAEPFTIPHPDGRHYPLTGARAVRDARATAVAKRIANSQTDPRKRLAETPRLADASVLEVMAASKRAFALVLAHPCPSHHALVNEPCWALPRAVCGPRVTWAHPPTTPATASPRRSR